MSAVMVAEAPPALNEPLIEDVLRSLKVTHDQVLQLAPESVAMLPSRCNSWRIGAVDELPEGSQISSPALDELKANKSA